MKHRAGLSVEAVYSCRTLVKLLFIGKSACRQGVIDVSERIARPAERGGRRKATCPRPLTSLGPPNLREGLKTHDVI
jgi:hypothetical protein